MRSTQNAVRNTVSSKLAASSSIAEGLNAKWSASPTENSTTYCLLLIAYYSLLTSSVYLSRATHSLFAADYYIYCWFLFATERVPPTECSVSTEERNGLNGEVAMRRDAI